MTWLIGIAFAQLFVLVLIALELFALLRLALPPEQDDKTPPLRSVPDKYRTLS